jgi:hypothetical protein
MLTIVEKADGSPCEVSGKSRWTKADVTGGIHGTLKEWLSCGGWDLDSEVPSLRSLDADEVGTPKLRITGADLRLEFRYYNKKHDHHVDFDGIVCKLRVSVEPRWNSWVRMAYSSVPDPDSGVGSFRYRKSFGVILHVGASGVFSYFLYTELITAIVSALVILGLPAKIIELVAAYGIGMISTIYRKAQAQRLNILKLACGVSSRLVVGVDAFRAFGGDPDKGCDEKAFMDRMRMAFQTEDDLGKDELQVLTGVVLSQMNRDKDGSDTNKAISMSEFLNCLTSEEPMSHQDLAKVFDKDRKRCINERLLSDSRLNVIRGRENRDKVVPVDA